MSEIIKNQKQDGALYAAIEETISRWRTIQKILASGEWHPCDLMELIYEMDDDKRNRLDPVVDEWFKRAYPQGCSQVDAEGRHKLLEG